MVDQSVVGAGRIRQTPAPRRRRRVVATMAASSREVGVRTDTYVEGPHTGPAMSAAGPFICRSTSATDRFQEDAHDTPPPQVQPMPGRDQRRQFVGSGGGLARDHRARPRTNSLQKACGRTVIVNRPPAADAEDNRARRRNAARLSQPVPLRADQAGRLPAPEQIRTAPQEEQPEEQRRRLRECRCRDHANRHHDGCRGAREYLCRRRTRPLGGQLERVHLPVFQSLCLGG